MRWLLVYNSCDIFPFAGRDMSCCIVLGQAKIQNVRAAGQPFWDRVFLGADRVGGVLRRGGKTICGNDGNFHRKPHP